MAFRTRLGLLIAFFFSINVYAEDIQINPAHPVQYTVASGDTLWDIAGKFLNHPWQWPDLWRYNTQIKNPHLIYPGDTIYFSIVNGNPQLSLSRNEQSFQLNRNSPCVLHEEDYINGRTSFPVTADGKLVPCIRETNLDQAIRLIPSDQITQFLTSPRVVDENELKNSPYVLEFAGEHIVGLQGDKVYVRSILNAKNRNYTLYRSGQTYISPDTGETLGYEAKYIASANLIQAGDPATFEIKSSESEIRPGDRLMPNLEEEITLNYFPRPPAQKIRGSIISVVDGVTQIGRHNIVVIDKGIKDGLQVGHELDIYRKGKTVNDPFSSVSNASVNLPDEQAGVLMVFRPFQRVSYALVMKASQAIHIFDRVQTP
jgi:hypothetical protein